MLFKNSFLHFSSYWCILFITSFIEGLWVPSVLIVFAKYMCRRFTEHWWRDPYHYLGEEKWEHRGKRAVALTGIPEKGFIYPFKWFITNITFRRFWWGRSLSSLLVSFSANMLPCPLRTIFKQWTGWEKPERRKDLVLNQPFPFTITIYLIKVPKSKILPKKMWLSLPHDREESALLFSKYINQLYLDFKKKQLCNQNVN